MKTAILTVALLATICQLASAQVGETKDQTDKRFGQNQPYSPTNIPTPMRTQFPEMEKVYLYQRGDFDIAIGFSNGVSIVEFYDKATNQLTDKDVQSILNENAGKSSWRSSMKVEAWELYERADKVACVSKIEGVPQVVVFDGRLLKGFLQRFTIDPQKVAAYRASKEAAQNKLIQQDPRNTAKQEGPPKITGAFGIVLGTKVDLSRYRTEATYGDVPLYAFSPKNPVAGMTQYYFQATPRTGIIYAVLAFGNCENSRICEERLAALYAILKEKYQPPERFADKFFGEDIPIKSFAIGNRSVCLMCKPGFLVGQIDESGLVLQYEDSDLEKQAEKERIGFERQKLDDKGL